MKMLKIALPLTVLAGFSLLGTMQAEAARLPDLPDVVERSGLYSHPTRKNVKVRVFVHKTTARPERSAPRVCGLADPESTAAVPAAGWKLPSAVTYHLNVSTVPASIGAANLATLVDDGFDNWSAASGGQVLFTRGANTSTSRSLVDGKNIIAWGRTVGQALGVTYIYYEPATGNVLDVDTIMNSRYKWSWENATNCAHTGSYDAENVMTHELGHWMGLNDTYTSPFLNNTMFGYADKGEVKKTTLTAGDVAGIQAIY